MVTEGALVVAVKTIVAFVTNLLQTQALARNAFEFRVFALVRYFIVHPTLPIVFLRLTLALITAICAILLTITEGGPGDAHVA